MNKDERLEKISKASLKLVYIIDNELDLNDKELDIVIFRSSDPSSAPFPHHFAIKIHPQSLALRLSLPSR